MRGRAAISGAALLAAALTAFAAEVVDLADAAKRGWLREDFYGVYCGDVQVGWLRRSLARTTFEEREAVAREVELHLDVVGDGNDIVSTTRTVFSADGPQLLLAARMDRIEQGRALSREIVRRGMRFDVVTTRRGERVEGAVPSATITLADELGFERAAASPGTAVIVTGIDLSTLVAAPRTYSAAPAPTRDAPPPAPAAPVPVVPVPVVDVLDVTVAAGAMKETARAESSGSVIEGTLGPRFRYRRTTEAAAKDPAFRGSIEKLSRVPLVAGDAPAKLRDVGAIEKFVVAWDDGRDRVFAVSARQTVRRDGKSVVVEVARDAAGAPVTDDARAEALADGPGLDLSEPLVGEAATRLLSGTADRGPQVGRILELTSTGIRKEIVLGTPRMLELLQNPRGDCTEHVRVFVALCRVAGIPARAVEGLSWTGDEAGAFGWHMWAEVALGGKWVTVDPTTGANPAPATHLAVDAAPEVRTHLWGAKLRLVEAAPAPAPERPR